MPTTAVNRKDLLDAVKQMPPDDFEAFIQEALLLRKPPPATLSAQETKLVKQINRGLPQEMRRRCAQLIGRQKKGPRHTNLWANSETGSFPS
jgi:hypothetical protein